MNWFELLDRTMWLAVGMLAGMMLGYTIRARQEAHEALERVEAVSKEESETFGKRTELFSNIALAVVVVITVWSAFSSQVASNDVARIQEVEVRESQCTSSILFRTVEAVNERTTNSAAQGEANRALQASEAELIRAILNAEDQFPERSLQEYLEAYNTYEALLRDTADRQQEFAYPTPEEYADCLQAAREEG